MGMSVNHSHFIAAWLEALLYGINMLLFMTCFWVLYCRPVNGNRSTVMLSAITTMFVLNTVHVAGTLKQADDAFFVYDATTATITAYFNNRKQPLNLMLKSVYGCVILIGDGLLIYRCWIIWAKNIVIIIAPIATLIGTAITGWYLVYDFSKLTSGHDLFAGQAKILTPLTFALSLVTNVITTMLMVWRISTVSRIPTRNGRTSGAAYRRTLAVIIESGAIIPVVLLVSLAFYLAGMNEESLLTGPMSQIIGIIPTLTLLQVRLGYSQYDNSGKGRNPDVERTVVGTGTVVLSRKETMAPAHGNSTSDDGDIQKPDGMEDSQAQSSPTSKDFDTIQEIEMKPTTLEYKPTPIRILDPVESTTVTPTPTPAVAVTPIPLQPPPGLPPSKSPRVSFNSAASPPPVGPLPPPPTNVEAPPKPERNLARLSPYPASSSQSQLAPALLPPQHRLSMSQAAEDAEQSSQNLLERPKSLPAAPSAASLAESHPDSAIVHDPLELLESESNFRLSMSRPHSMAIPAASMESLVIEPETPVSDRTLHND